MISNLLSVNILMFIDFKHLVFLHGNLAEFFHVFDYIINPKTRTEREPTESRVHMVTSCVKPYHKKTILHFSRNPRLTIGACETNSRVISVETSKVLRLNLI